MILYRNINKIQNKSIRPYNYRTNTYKKYSINRREFTNSSTINIDTTTTSTPPNEQTQLQIDMLPYIAADIDPILVKPSITPQPKWMTMQQPIEQFEAFIIGTHSITNTPWYISLAISALCLRLCILPFSFMQLQLLAKLQNLRPIWQHIITMYFGSTKKYNNSIVRIIPKTESLYICTKIFLQYINIYKLRITRLIYPSCISIPLFITFNAACRQLMYGESTAEIAETLSTEGPFWCTNLMQPDTTLYLPLIAFITTIVNLHYVFIKYQDLSSTTATATVTTAITTKKINNKKNIYIQKIFNRLKNLRKMLIPDIIAKNTINIETNDTNKAKSSTNTNEHVKKVLPRFILVQQICTATIIPFVIHLPSSLFIYWITSMICNIFQSIFLQSRFLRKFAGFSTKQYKPIPFSLSWVQSDIPPTPIAVSLPSCKLNSTLKYDTGSSCSKICDYVTK